MEASGGFEVPRDDPGEERRTTGYPGFERRCCKADGDGRFVIAEMKGTDWGGLTDVKAQAAHRWCAAVNATGEFGQWDYRLAFSVREFATQLDALAAQCVEPTMLPLC